MWVANPGLKKGWELDLGCPLSCVPVELSDEKAKNKQGMVVNTCKPSAWETVAGRS